MIKGTSATDSIAKCSSWVVLTVVSTQKQIFKRHSQHLAWLQLKFVPVSGYKGMTLTKRPTICICQILCRSRKLQKTRGIYHYRSLIHKEYLSIFIYSICSIENEEWTLYKFMVISWTLTSPRYAKFLYALIWYGIENMEIQWICSVVDGSIWGKLETNWRSFVLDACISFFRMQGLGILSHLHYKRMRVERFILLNRLRKPYTKRIDSALILPIIPKNEPLKRRSTVGL